MPRYRSQQRPQASLNTSKSKHRASTGGIAANHPNLSFAQRLLTRAAPGCSIHNRSCTTGTAAFARCAAAPCGRGTERPRARLRRIRCNDGEGSGEVQQTLCLSLGCCCIHCLHCTHAGMPQGPTSTVLLVMNEPVCETKAAASGSMRLAGQTFSRKVPA
jgi:hypothetical protein